MSVTCRWIAAGLLTPLAAMRLSAQAPAACSAQQYNVSVSSGGDDVERMQPQVSRTRYAALVDSGKWIDAMGAVGADAAKAFRAAGVPPADSGKFMHQVDEAMRALRSHPGRPNESLQPDQRRGWPVLDLHRPG